MYKSCIEPVKRRLYSSSELKIPFPQYIIFYNGIEERSEREELELSKLFIESGKGKKPSLECTALVLNVNYGHNKELMERSKTLNEYAKFVATIRNNLAEDMEIQEAVERAVDACIREGVLADILRKNRSEIMDSILTEWDEEDFIEGVKKIQRMKVKLKKRLKCVKNFMFQKKIYLLGL